jgi:putative oxidoreductase
MSVNMDATTPYTARQAASSGAALLLVARIFVAALFLVAGARKLLGYAATAAYFTKLGFPAGDVMAVAAIVIELGGGLMLLVGWRTRWAAWLLVLFVAVATAMAHRFLEVDASQLNNQMNHFLKNVAIIGGLFYVATFGAGRLSLDRACAMRGAHKTIGTVSRTVPTPGCRTAIK